MHDRSPRLRVADRDELRCDDEYAVDKSGPQFKAPFNQIKNGTVLPQLAKTQTVSAQADARLK
jgi:hypothetical protein